MDNRAFDYQRIAEGYAKDRPFLHARVMERIKRDLDTVKELSPSGRSLPFSNGLDVGCGAGLSTKALKMICGRVTGIDISEEMVLAAKSLYTDPEYAFFQCSAEEVGRLDGGFDIATAAGVINWVDESYFLTGLKKVLSPAGTAVIYDFWISDRMKGSEAYTDWWETQYLVNFPKPSRKEAVWTDADVRPYGFSMEKQVTYSMEYEMDREAFVRFMLLQSNVSAQVEGNGRPLEAVRQWFLQSLELVFAGERKTLIFEGYSWYLKKI